MDNVFRGKTGTKEITEYLENIREQIGKQEDIESIFDIAGRCTEQTRCFLPTQESILIPNIIEKFSRRISA